MKTYLFVSRRLSHRYLCKYASAEPVPWLIPSSDSFGPENEVSVGCPFGVLVLLPFSVQVLRGRPALLLQHLLVVLLLEALGYVEGEPFDTLLLLALCHFLVTQVLS